MIDLDRRTIKLDKKHRLGLARIADMDEILGRLDGGLVHHFHAARNDAGRDDFGDAGARRLARIEGDHQRARAFGLLQDADGDFGDDAEHALRADDEAEQIIAVGIEMRAAEPDDLAGHQHHFDAEHIIGGEAIFEAMHAAGIFGDIAADRAGDLRGGVGGVIKAPMLDRAGDRRIGDAGLDDGDAVVEIDLLDAVELHHRNKDAVLKRQGAAGQRGAGAARHDLDVVGMAPGKDGLEFFDGRGQHHGERQVGVGGEAVALIGAPADFAVDDAFAAHDFAQGGDDVGRAAP